jgi:hypothetical protein
MGMVVDVKGDSSVVVDVVSSMQRLSPETQSSLDSSMVGQFRNKMHSKTD